MIKMSIYCIACGFGKLLVGFRNFGYKKLYGADISQEAVDYCKSKELNVQKIDDLIQFSYFINFCKKV